MTTAIAVQSDDTKTDEVMAVNKAPVLIGERGVVIRTLEDLWRFAKMVVASGCAPTSFKTEEAVCIAVQMGLELGLSPMSSLHHIAVINGKPSLYGDGLLGVCKASGLFDESKFHETIEGKPGTPDWTATCTACRKGGNPVTQTFSWADATKAGLTGRGPWQGYPSRMLKMRARGFVLRDVFADVLCGFISTEEAQDIPVHVDSVVVASTNGAPERRPTAREVLMIDTPTTPPPAKETTNKGQATAKKEPEPSGDVAISPKLVKESLMALNKTMADPIKKQFKIESYQAINGMDQDRLRELSAAIQEAKDGKGN